METEIQYSVIVPVWNGEKTICRCLDSLLCQNRQDAEILVIDDGSEDSTPEILRGYAARYPNLRAIRQERGGVSRARNRGLELARGPYVTFVDSDDYVTESYFAVLDSAPDCDLLVFRREPVGGTDKREQTLFAQLSAEKDTERKLAILLADRKLTAPWNKRFRAERIRRLNLRFPEDLDTGEDFCFCFAYALGCRSVECLPQVLYRVDLSNENSLSRRYRPDLADTMCFVYRYGASLPGAEVYGGELDWQSARCALGCLAEECKAVPFGKLPPERLGEICGKFRLPLSPERVNLRHRLLRLALGLRLDGLLYAAAYLGKGRKWSKGRNGTWRK